MDSDAVGLSPGKRSPREKFSFLVIHSAVLVLRLAALKNPARWCCSSLPMPELAGALYPYLPIKWLCRFKYDTIAYLQKQYALF